MTRHGDVETHPLTSKLFCIIPRPNHPKSPPLRALEQSLSSAAIRANSLLISSAGRDWRYATCFWIVSRATVIGRVMLSWCKHEYDFQDASFSPRHAFIAPHFALSVLLSLSIFLFLPISSPSVAPAIRPHRPPFFRLALPASSYPSRQSHHGHQSLLPFPQATSVEKDQTHLAPRTRSSTPSVLAKDMARPHLPRLSTSGSRSSPTTSQILRSARKRSHLVSRHAFRRVPDRLRCLRVVEIRHLARVGESDFPAGHWGQLRVGPTGSGRGIYVLIVCTLGGLGLPWRARNMDSLLDDV